MEMTFDVAAFIKICLFFEREVVLPKKGEGFTVVKMKPGGSYFIGKKMTADLHFYKIHARSTEFFNIFCNFCNSLPSALTFKRVSERIGPIPITCRCILDKYTTGA